MLKIFIHAFAALALLTFSPVAAKADAEAYEKVLARLGDYALVKPFEPQDSSFEYYRQVASFPKGGPVLSEICPALLDAFPETSNGVDLAVCQSFLADINGLRDVHTIIAGQPFLLPEGPAFNTVALMRSRIAEAQHSGKSASAHEQTAGLSVEARLAALEKEVGDLRLDVSRQDGVLAQHEERLDTHGTRLETLFACRFRPAECPEQEPGV